MIGFLDPFIHSPVVKCFENFQENFGQSFHHQPSAHGMQSLIENAPWTKAYYIAGSASNVTEPLEWHSPLASFLLIELKLGKPVFGACFGHQLLCHAFGSEVGYAYPTQDKILGLRKIKLLNSFWSFTKDDIFHLPVTHRQVVISLGEGLVSVGHGLANDIVMHATLPLLTTQGHPEASKHFCEFDIKNLTEEEISKGKNDGHRLIKSFFNYHIK
jgi:GMP synthase-like glutamine amidotransferase